MTRDFGPQARLGIRPLEADWFDKWVKKTRRLTRDRTPPGPLLHIFVMGPDIWREEHEWPLARTRYTPLYLESEGRANSSAGDGTLRWQPVSRSKTDTFTYDPRDPVPTMGGAICCEPRILPPGPLDQTTVETRKDVLVYTSAPLAEDLEVTGPVRTILYVATSANDTDFTAKIVDVDPRRPPAFGHRRHPAFALPAIARQTDLRQTKPGLPDQRGHRRHEPCFRERPPHPVGSVQQQLPALRPQHEYTAPNGDRRSP